MNRSIKQQVANQQGPSSAQDVGREMPYWSNYLLRLSTQVKQAANTKIWEGEPVAADAPNLRARQPGADRRLSVDQRRERIGSGGSLPHPAEAGGLPQGHLAQANSQANKTDSTSAGQSPDAPRYGIRGPIGDRRIKQRRRSALYSRGSGKDRGKWLFFLPRLWGRMRGIDDTHRAADMPEELLRAKFSMGIWGYYFIAKLGMSAMEFISFHTWENLVFAAFILLPVSSRILLRAKNALCAVLALMLLYYDSWLPPVGRLISQASLLSDFSFAYLLELSGRFISLPVVGVLVAAGFLYWFVSRRVRLGILVIASMLVYGGIQYLQSEKTGDKVKVDADMNKVLQDFFAKEAQRAVLFVTPQADAVPFDLIFIHVCSLSWDDVRAVGLDSHPLWKRFDILLTKFNSAASYSGPAALHLLRAKCGQPTHGGMYLPVADKCYLMNSLQRSGFVTNVVLNHDGKFDDFLGQVQSHGRLTAQPMMLDGLDIAQYAFDNSPVYDDLSVLGRWMDTRNTSDSSRVALYYNSVSMHDGNHLSGTDATPNTLETYKARLSKFLDETDAFLQKLDESGRRAVVVMVPEHGAAVRGDKRQFAGLREIPTPAISLVPVGIRVVGGSIHREGEPLVIEQSTSYLAISYIVERMLEQSPFNGNSFLPSDFVMELPVTPFVSQNETTTVAEHDGQYYLSRGATQWEPYAEFNKPAVQP